jgi:hypothetical protein
MRLICLLLIAISSIITGCRHASRDIPSHPGRVTREQAITLARKLFRASYPGELAHFQMHAPEHPDNGEWRISFQGQGEYLVPGSLIFVSVDERTGKAEVEPHK